MQIRVSPEKLYVEVEANGRIIFARKCANQIQYEVIKRTLVAMKHGRQFDNSFLKQPKKTLA